MRSHAIFVLLECPTTMKTTTLLASNITVASWSQSGLSILFVNSGTNNFTAGDWVNARFLTVGHPACNGNDSRDRAHFVSGSHHWVERDHFPV